MECDERCRGPAVTTPLVLSKPTSASMQMLRRGNFSFRFPRTVLPQKQRRRAVQ